MNSNQDTFCKMAQFELIASLVTIEKSTNWKIESYLVKLILKR